MIFRFAMSKCTYRAQDKARGTCGNSLGKNHCQTTHKNITTATLQYPVLPETRDGFNTSSSSGFYTYIYIILRHKQLALGNPALIPQKMRRETNRAMRPRRQDSRTTHKPTIHAYNAR